MSAIFNREMSSNLITDNFNKSIKLYKQVQSYNYQKTSSMIVETVMVEHHM